MYRPQPTFLRPKSIIATTSIESLGIPLAATSSTSGSLAWPATNRTIYVPFHLHWPFLAKRLFCLNGSTVGTNTITMGLYHSDASGLPSSRMVTASATSAGANACQYFDITDTQLYPGLYYVAIAMNGTTATLNRFGGSAVLQHMQTLCFQDASNCPDPAVPALLASLVVPNVGMDCKGAL